MILAAGASTRLGRPKQLLEYRQKSLLRHAVETAIDSRCNRVVVVLGGNSEKMISELKGLAVLSVTNAEWESGMSSSIRAGLKALVANEPSMEGVIIMLCDQPLLSTDTINSMIDRFRLTGNGIVASEYGGTIGVPALFSRTYLSELESLGDKSGAKQLLKRYAAEVAKVPFPEGEFDIDVEEDYERLKAWQG
jgi:molybdenum cofactor cytidylyltransferase